MVRELGLDSRSPPEIRCVLCIVGKQEPSVKELLRIYLVLGQLCESCP